MHAGGHSAHSGVALHLRIGDVMPARYEIRIACALSGTIRAAFPELDAVQLSPSSTVLAGPVRDQADLHAILARIADLGIDIMEIRPQP
jgi:hypothetical protein